MKRLLLDALVWTLAILTVLGTGLTLLLDRALTAIVTPANTSIPATPRLLPAAAPADLSLRRMSNAQLRDLAGTKRRLPKRQLIALIEQRRSQAAAA